MNMRLTSFLPLILISGLQSFAQENTGQQHASYSQTPQPIILYDPLFWKSELKLSTAQQRKIDKINSDFYENIKSVYGKKELSTSNSLTDLLTSRSELIWSTFHQRQKRKWEKLDSLNSLPQDFGRTQSVF